MEVLKERNVAKITVDRIKLGLKTSSVIYEHSDPLIRLDLTIELRPVSTRVTVFSYKRRARRRRKRPNFLMIMMTEKYRQDSASFARFFLKVLWCIRLLSYVHVFVHTCNRAIRQLIVGNSYSLPLVTRWCVRHEVPQELHRMLSVISMSQYRSGSRALDQWGK